MKHSRTDSISVEEFCITGSGGTPSRSNSDFYGGSIPWVKSGELREAIILDTEEKITEEAINNSSAKIVPKGAILLAMYGATIGRLAMLGIEAATNQAICNIRPDVTVADTRYVYRALEAKVPELIAQATGGAQPNISQEKIRKLRIWLPSIGEQKRIAAILDKADALRRRRRQALALLDSLTQSIFLEMFGDPVSNPKGWPVRDLADFEAFLTSGSRGWANFYSEHGRPFIRIQNLKNGNLSTEDLVFVDAPDNAEALRTTVSAGDILISITADLGRIAVVPSSLDGAANINQHIALFRPRGINSVFLASYLASDGGKRQFAASNRQGVKAGLNFADIRRLRIIVPPSEIQQKFEHVIGRLEGRQSGYIASRGGKDSLFASLQHRAFSGQL